MATAREYDGDIQMFVEHEREVDVAHLRFLRWLAERGNLEHETAGRSHGVYALSEVILDKVDDVAEYVSSAGAECTE